MAGDELERLSVAFPSEILGSGTHGVSSMALSPLYMMYEM